MTSISMMRIELSDWLVVDSFYTDGFDDKLLYNNRIYGYLKQNKNNVLF